MARINYKRILAAVASAAMLAGYAASFSPAVKVSAEVQLLGETSFDHKAYPWHTVETSPARQNFRLDDGAFHVAIIKADGGDGSKWDLQFRHRNLNLVAGHDYEISFKVRSERDGMELCSKISDYNGNEEYVSLFEDGTMGAGPYMGGEWGTPLKMTTEWQTVSGSFKCTQDLENVQWVFEYANATANSYGGNAKDGDEIWFDDMSIVDITSNDSSIPAGSYYVNRDASVYKSGSDLIPYISVNQLGYYSKLSKVAVLGDNKGDVAAGASSIDLTEDTYDFELCDAQTDETVFKGTSGIRIKDKDSGDSICKLDFSEFKKSGKYYLKVGEWRSFDFDISDNIYTDSMLTNAVNYFYLNRAESLRSKYITSGNGSMLVRNAANRGRTAYIQKIWKNEYSSESEATKKYASSFTDVSGGWYDEADCNRYVVNGGISVWTLQNMYEMSCLSRSDEKFEDGSGTVVVPETENGVPDILDEAAYELDWMEKMTVKEDDPTWGQFAGMVYHSVEDYNTKLAYPFSGYDCECMPPAQIVKPPTFAATLNYAACAAQAARLWAPYDSEKAAAYLENAKTAYEAYLKNYYEPDLTEAIDEANVYTVREALNETSLYAPAMRRVTSSYSDYDVKDDAYWAACELYVSAKCMGDPDADKYYSEIKEYNGAFKVPVRIEGGENKAGSLTSFNWGNTAAAGTMTLNLHTEFLPEAEIYAVKDAVVEAADTYCMTELVQGYGIPYKYDGTGNDIGSGLEIIVNNGYQYASNSMVINNAVIMAYAYYQTHDEKYINGVSTAMDYLLGTNPLSFSYITGYGTYHAENPDHCYWQNEFNRKFPKAPDGVLVSGPNAGLQDAYLRLLGFVPGEDYPSQRCYADSIYSWSANVPDADSNASLAWMLSFLKDNVPVSHVTDDENADITYGDLNADSEVDLSDLTVLSQYNLRDITLEGDQLKAADCNADGTVDITDIALLKQYIMKDKVTLGPEKTPDFV